MIVATEMQVMHLYWSPVTKTLQTPVTKTLHAHPCDNPLHSVTYTPYTSNYRSYITIINRCTCRLKSLVLAEQHSIYLYVYKTRARDIREHSDHSMDP